MKTKPEIFEDRWIPTQCAMCYGLCGIRGRRVNGVVTRLEGNPDSFMGARGGMCGKGVASLQLLYDPNRLNVPLRRTNPEKGLHADPRWQEITWEEAFAEITAQMKRIIDDNPSKILIISGTSHAPINTYTVIRQLKAVCQTPQGEPENWAGGGALHCGNGAHMSAGIMHGAWSVTPDFKYCNYVILFGASKGHGAGHSAAITTRLAAEARARGMKLVVFDPICNFAGGKATEWIPIIPGTDAAVALAMCNVMVNELGIYDAYYVSKKTNGPYLIGSDGHYVRNKDNNKPLIWDGGAGRAKDFDDPSIEEYSLEGIYEVDKRSCRPAFALLKEHLKKYSVDEAARISTVPAGTIRRLAEEFAVAASVGSTIMIEGKSLPFRPVSAVLFRGGQGHANSAHTCFAVSLLNHLLGAADVPGGTLGWPSVSAGTPEGRFQVNVETDADGFLVTAGTWVSGSGHKPWPPHAPKVPTKPGLNELFPNALHTIIHGSADQEEIREKVGLPYRTEMIFTWACNPVISVANPEILAQALRKVPFIVAAELYDTEFTEGFADIVLPDACLLEALDWTGGLGFLFNYPFGTEPWCCHITQPLMPPPPERKYIAEFIFELADRLGRREQLHAFWNQLCDFDEEHKIGPAEKISWPELNDRALRWSFGSEHGLEWFKEHGFLLWPKKVEEAYWRHFHEIRVPIYLEFLIDQGKQLQEITQKLGIRIDLSPYTPLLEWFPCPPHKLANDESGEYDLYCFSYRDILHTASITPELPWIDEVSQTNPYTYNVTLNIDTAREKGLRDGDTIWLESARGRKVKGTLKTLAGQHPQTVSIAACTGHWAQGLPIARGKGTHFDTLMELDLEHSDPISSNIETCVRVKISKAGGRPDERMNG